MNKYEEALHMIERSLGQHGWFTDSETDTLQELVQRATPMKPNGMFDDECPMCHNDVIDIGYGYKFKFCPICGQSLDLGEEDEK